MKTCYILGALPVNDIIIDNDQPHILIAADNGCRTLEKLGLKADFLIGDFDSLGFIPQTENVITYPVEKDYTDLHLAIRQGLSLNCDKFIIYGALGERLDHTFANIQLLCELAIKGKQGFLIGETEIVTAINSSEITFSENQSGFISVFASDKASGINLTNLKYPLTNHTLTNTFPLGARNEFIGKKATISVKSGTLILIYDNNNFEF